MSETLVASSNTDDTATNTALLTERNSLSLRVKDLERQLADSCSGANSAAVTNGGGMGDQNVQLTQLQTENKTLRQQLCVCYPVYFCIIVFCAFLTINSVRITFELS